MFSDFKDGGGLASMRPLVQGRWAPSILLCVPFIFVPYIIFIFVVFIFVMCFVD